MVTQPGVVEDLNADLFEDELLVSVFVGGLHEEAVGGGLKTIVGPKTIIEGEISSVAT